MIENGVGEQKKKDGNAIYHRVLKHEGFEESAQTLFGLIKTSQAKYPNAKRTLYLEIEGHRNSEGGFDKDMLELQTEFFTELLMPYLTEAYIPLGGVVNAMQQINDLPDVLNITKNA